MLVFCIDFLLGSNQTSGQRTVHILFDSRTLFIRCLKLLPGRTQCTYGTVQCTRSEGRVLSSHNSDWPAVRLNLRKARAKWALVFRILARDGATPRISAFFYKAIVQAVLLFGSETWHVTQSMLNHLSTFHHHAARHISGHRARYRRDTGEWEGLETSLRYWITWECSLCRFISQGNKITLLSTWQLVR